MKPCQPDKWPRSLVLKMACSASFFSRNSVFLSQQFSRNSVSSQFQPSFRPANGAKTKTAHERKPTKAPKIPLSTLHRGEAKNSGSYRLLLVPTTHFPSLSREDEQWTTSMRGRSCRRRRDAAAAMGPGAVAAAGGAAARRHGWGSWTPCSAPSSASCAAPPAPRPASCSAREREMDGGSGCR